MKISNGYSKLSIVIKLLIYIALKYDLVPVLYYWVKPISQQLSAFLYVQTDSMANLHSNVKSIMVAHHENGSDVERKAVSLFYNLRSCRIVYRQVMSFVTNKIVV